ncbi:arf-GAP with dual PH domain-containing protein 1 isoform X2 [Conger conger]|uniref:arf-GAP with dual PH domain-containing protein 1 isoform X2 n=1 Tax=Conger conger TaxID=82655 RepID=UPI002A599E3B|nr:arf-GAP with dual PH domain-containing protein 1 isoform X2 [Conger conger]
MGSVAYCLDFKRKILLDLVKQPDNNRCADCGSPDPDWASCTLGVFVCLTCSGTHRNLTNGSRIKSIRLDLWDDELVQFMRANGNASARELYEMAVPPFYYRPREQDCVVLREQWIRAKYERQEFSSQGVHLQQVYSSGLYAGSLWKKGRDNGQFLKRRFVLSDRDFTLRYFTSDLPSKGPKAVIAVKTLNASFQPEKIGHPHGLQLTYLCEDHTRNLFLYHTDGQEIVNWFNAIRAARLAYLQTAFPTATDSELQPWITRNYLKEGYMEKTGPLREPFKKRWFVLDAQDRKLLYFKTQLDAVELGVAFLGTAARGYSVRESEPKGARGNKWKFGVTVETPWRQFVFMCELESEQREWVAAFSRVISQPMTPQDYATEVNLMR